MCFFGSGAAALLYEVVWSKQLSYLLGSSLHATATVVAAFLCGLALGARVLGTPLARRGEGARIYALLEVGVGLLGIVSLPVLRGLDPVVGELYRALGGESASFALARLALLFALLVPPAALMGATLPVLVAAFEPDRLGPGLARLYAWNTLGAVAGSVAGGFALLPGIGLQATTVFAAALNLVVAVVAWLASRRPIATASSSHRTAEMTEPAAEPADGQGTRPATPSAPSASKSSTSKVPPGGLVGRERLLFVLLCALSGVAALAFQIAWIRLFSLVFGSTVYSFSAVLGVYLLGLALGSAAVARWVAARVTLATFARLQLALAACAALMLHGFSRLPQWMFDLAEWSGPRWESLILGEIGLATAMLILPCALLGATFPIAARLFQLRDGGHAVGVAYAVNTAGTIAGSLAAGFFAIPVWGVQGTQIAALGLSMAIGLVALGMAMRRKDSAGADPWMALASIVVVASFAVTAAPWDPALMSAGSFRPRAAAILKRFGESEHGSGSLVWRASRAERVLYYREGVNASVYVGSDPGGQVRWLRVGGKIDASTNDMETQVVVGLLPTACADSAARSLVVGLGSGITLSAMLAAGAGPTEVIEIERGVVEASRFFHPPGENPLDDPRVRLLIGDARTHLAHGGGRYGIIVSEPSNPWIAGVNNLFTVDFYRLVRDRLEPDGVFCQWVQLYELSPETLKTILASFLSVFHEGHAFAVWRAQDLVLLAAPGGRRIALERLENPAARGLLERAQVASPRELPAYYASSFETLRPLAEGAPLNRDDRPIVEYRAPRDLVAVGRLARSQHPEVGALLPFAEGPPAGALFSSWNGAEWFESRARPLLARGDSTRAGFVARGAERAGYGALAQRLRLEIESSARRAGGLREFERARGLLTSGRREEALRTLERSVEIDPSNGLVWVALAHQRRLAGNMPGVASAIAHVGDHEPAEVLAEARLIAGMLEVDRGRRPQALARFLEAQRLNPSQVTGYLLEAEVRRQGGDIEGARAALRRGLQALPNHPDLATMLAGIEGPTARP